MAAEDDHGLFDGDHEGAFVVVVEDLDFFAGGDAEVFEFVNAVAVALHGKNLYPIVLLHLGKGNLLRASFERLEGLFLCWCVVHDGDKFGVSYEDGEKIVKGNQI